MGARASVVKCKAHHHHHHHHQSSVLLTETQFRHLVEVCKLFRDKDETQCFIANNITSWPVSRLTMQKIYTSYCLYNNGYSAAAAGLNDDEDEASSARETMLHDCVTKTLLNTLNKHCPDIKQLPVLFAEVTNTLMHEVYLAAKMACNSYLKQVINVTSRQDLDQFHHHELVERSKMVVTTCPERITSSINWTAPQDKPSFQRIKKVLADDQAAFSKFHKDQFVIQEGESENYAAAVAQCKLQFVKHCNAQVQFYKAFLHNVWENQTETCARIVLLTQELNPKYANVYTATGSVVKEDKCYALFISTEQKIFTDINKKLKPRQPVQNVVELLWITYDTKPMFDAVMHGVQKSINVADNVRTGGVTYHAAPPKKVVRIIEKLCLHPSAHEALESGHVDSLDASRILDTTRGMFICSTMSHARQVILTLQEFHCVGMITLERSKNRFAVPSAGGWMDCLINLRMPNGHVCEVQIVHRQLLTIRSELGAHASYATYRTGSEVLESIGCEGAVQGPTAMKRMLAEQVMKLCVDSDGSPVDISLKDIDLSATKFGDVLEPTIAADEQRLYAFPPLVQLDLSQVSHIAGFQKEYPRENLLVAFLLKAGIHGVHCKSKHCSEVVESLSALQMKTVDLLSRTMDAHSDWIRSVSFSCDGKLLASASQDKTVKVWNPKDCGLIWILEGHTDYVVSVSFSYDSKILASASNDQTLMLWKMEDGSLIRTLKGHTNHVKSVSFSPDDKLLISASLDKTAKLWNTENGSLIRTFEGHMNSWSSTFNHDGKILVFSSNQTVNLWDIKNSSLIQALEGHNGMVTTVSFSNDGKVLASASEDRTVRLWKPEDGSLLQILEGHNSWVMAVSFSHNGKLLASASMDKTVKLWNVADGRLIMGLDGHTGSVLSVSFHPDCKLLASASEDATIKLWNIEDRSLITRTFKGHNEHILHIDFSANGKTLAGASVDGTVKLWNTENNNLVQVLEGHAAMVVSVSFSFDEKVIASASLDKTVKLWNLEDGSLIWTLEGHTDHVFTVSFSPDNQLLASAGADTSVKFWNKENGSLIRTLDGHDSHISCVLFSCDSQLLASASVDTTVKLWNTRDGSLIRILEGHTDQVTSASFSPNNGLLVSASFDKTLKLWNAEDGSLIWTLEGHLWAVTYATFSPDGRLLASASVDKTVRLWKVEDGSLLRTLTGHTAIIQSISFSPDGKFLACALADKTVKLITLIS